MMSNNKLPYDKAYQPKPQDDQDNARRDRFEYQTDDTRNQNRLYHHIINYKIQASVGLGNELLSRAIRSNNNKHQDLGRRRRRREYANRFAHLPIRPSLMRYLILIISVAIIGSLLVVSGSFADSATAKLNANLAVDELMTPSTTSVSLPKNYTALIKFESTRTQQNQSTEDNLTQASTLRPDKKMLDQDQDDFEDQDDEITTTASSSDDNANEILFKPQIARRRPPKYANIYSAERNRSLGAGEQLTDVGNLKLSVAESNQKHLANAECALILKRTYILRGQGDEWGDKFVFNDQDPDDEKRAEVHKSDLCIKHADVERAIEEAKHKMKFEQPEDLDSFEVSEKSISSVGELSLATGQLLAKKFDLSHDEILNALPMIDMSSVSKFSCPRHVRPMMCMRTRYRTITAHCNNLKHPSWGATNTPYSRYLPPDYADGLDLPRASRSGEPLPSARLISMLVHRDMENPSNDHSAAFASWGQLLNHDVTRAALGQAPECCPAYLKGLCMPIPVPPSDDFYGRFNVKCLKFDRTPAAIRPKCLLGLRAQINTVTSPVDASIVYGSTRAQAQKLRKFKDGKMRVLNYFEKQNLKPLLPPKTEKPDDDCLARPKKLFCFEAGDVRVNEQTHLTVLHTIYVREHNRLAHQLAKLNMDWDDEKIYQETRRIVYACEQHVVVNEFLPLLLGARFMKEYAIQATTGGATGDLFWQGYDPSVTTSTGTGFAAAAFRYGHSMVDSLIKRLSPQGHLIKAEKLRNLFKRPFVLYEPGAVDQLILGMVWTSAERTDPFVSEELSGHLFQPPKAKFGHDLAAINIQRGRDQGVPGYNEWREWCGLPRAKSFSDLEPLLTNQTAHLYSRIYKHVDDIDLWSAGISERKLPGAAVGPTMACIIARQFMNTKRGDRFWYENPGQPSSFSKAQLAEIKKVTLAKILCTNSDQIDHIQPMVMRLPHPIYNAKVACDSLPTINLKHWDSNVMDSF